MSNTHSRAIELLHCTLSELNWTNASLSLWVPYLEDCINCLLSTLGEHSRNDRNLLTAQGQKAIQAIHAKGFQLLLRWPRSSGIAVTEWLSQRFYWLTPVATQLISSHRLCSIVSSQLGQDKHKLPYWPKLLEWAMQLTARDNCCLLFAKDTTFDVEARSFTAAAKISTIEIILPSKSTSSKDLSQISRSSMDRELIDWLKQRLESAAMKSSSDERDSAIATSRKQQTQELCQHAVIDVSPGYSKLHEATAIELDRDKACVALADRICCLWIRANGKISHLVEQRLKDDRFQLASCFIALPQSIYTPEQNWKNQNVWLDRGAVGYVVQVDDWKSCSRTWLRCGYRETQSRISARGQSVQVKYPQQVCFSLQKWLDCLPAETWDYLTHCTRGSSAAWPQESEDNYVRRVWGEGATLPADPLIMLMHILQEGRLRGSNWLTRGDQPMVSLSAVPIKELLQRREFKSHRSKWDWEPYGFLFHKSWIPNCNQVRYGTEKVYRRLESHEQMFFQPLNGKQDWSIEQEWRVVGDIDLHALPSNAAVVFAKTKQEAEQLSWLSNFPVAWIET